MEFDFFDELDFDGTVGFKDIKIKAEVTNRIGMPMSVSATEVAFINEGGLKKELPMEPPFAFNVTAATESGSNHTVAPGKIDAPGASFTTTVSEILFESGKYPDGLKFDFTGKANHNNPDGATENFIVKNGDNALADVALTLTVPLHLKVSEYLRRDTVEFDYNDTFGDKQDVEKAEESIENVLIKLKVNNQLPFDVKLSAIAIDGNDNWVEDVLTPAEFTSGAEKEIDITLTKDMATKFRQGNVKNIVITTSASTAGEEYVKVTEDAYIDITVGLHEARINIPSNL
jgi:hypothetical protein